MTTAERAGAYLNAIPGSAEGGRDDATFRVACKLVELFDLPEQELLDLLLAWNTRASSPALPAAAVRKCLRSARRTTSYNHDLADGAATRGATRRQEARPAPAAAPAPPALPLPTKEELATALQRLASGTDEASERARAYLAGYGIDPAACGWGLAKLTPEGAGEAGLPRAAAGVRFLIPVYLPDGQLGDVRRYRGPFDAAANSEKCYPWAKGHGSAKPYGWHNLESGVNLVIWCEGEKDREALAAHGFAAVSHTCGSSSARKVAEELAEELVSSRRFLLLFDHDQAGRDAVAKLAPVLLDRGAAEVSVATWPEALLDGRETPAGFDAADWFAAGFTAEQLRELVLDPAEPFALPAEAEPADGRDLPDVGCCPPGDHRPDDIGNAERFAALCGTRFRYCFDWRTWLVYDGTRWARDTTNEALAAARAVARSILREAFAAADQDERSRLGKWALQSATRQRLDAMLYLAQPDLAVLSPALDADPQLLNCRNGTVDLRTGELRPHSSADLLTRRVEADFRPGADLADTPEADEWRRFLAFATNDDDDFAAFLRRAAGYSLTGDPNEEVLFFAYGPARTGKSTFLVTLGAILSDYAETCDIEAFLRKRDSGSDARPEIAKLQGVRFATAVEAGPNRSFAEAVLKWITGGEPISARALHENPVSWLPQFTLWLAANDRPNIRHDDSASWRRLRVLPFEHQVPEEQADRDLKRRLREQCADVVLAWAVRGCLEWQQTGLGWCDAVRQASSSYREAMDPIGDWLADCCEVGTSRAWWESTDDLFKSYSRWAEEGGERRSVTRKELGEKLQARGLERKQRGPRGKQQWGYEGIHLTGQGEFDFDEDDGPYTRENPPAERATTTTPGRLRLDRLDDSLASQPEPNGVSGLRPLVEPIPSGVREEDPADSGPADDGGDW